MSLTAVTELDVILITYDEPNKEYNWNNLQEKMPWAKRVDGVKGFDAAHKKAAEISETDYFITIDGDNIIHNDFLNQTIKLNNNSVISWASKNNINGLVYGNGGIKCWPKQLVLNMKTHEHSDDERNKIEFCWGIKYTQMNDCYSDTIINKSPFQAFRAGFREGVKMSLDQGVKISNNKFKDMIHTSNYRRLLIWGSIGNHVENGKYSIFGTRLGCYLTNLENFNIENVRDYDWFKEYFKTIEYSDEYNTKLKNILNKKLGTSFTDMNDEQSTFFTSVYVSPPRFGANVTEEIVQQLLKIK